MNDYKLYQNNTINKMTNCRLESGYYGTDREKIETEIRNIVEYSFCQYKKQCIKFMFITPKDIIVGDFIEQGDGKGGSINVTKINRVTIDGFRKWGYSPEPGEGYPIKFKLGDDIIIKRNGVLIFNDEKTFNRMKQGRADVGIFNDNAIDS